MARILFIDDDAGGRQMACFNLRQAGHEVDEADSGGAGLDAFDPEVHDLVITDVRMPEISGIEVTRRIVARAASVPVLVITAFGTIETAIEAMKAGARDFVLKPFSRDQLLMVVEKALEHRRLKEENEALHRQLRGVERPIVYESRVMRDIVAMTDRIASSQATVLITGESGTGKELIARRLHAGSTRAEGPFVPVNCAAIPDELIESELFGHVRGAFTGADRARPGRFRQADGGTLFLDEVSELSGPAQSKLLRALQEGVIDEVGGTAPVSVDIRVIAATNRNLVDWVEEGRFREDLLFRLNVMEIDLPPLRDRREDIPALIRHFVEKSSEAAGLTISDEAVAVLQRRDWPGNIRELRNACERMSILALEGQLDPAVLSARTSRPATADREMGDWFELPEAGFSLLDLERSVIERVLRVKGGNISEAARYLGVPRHFLVYRIGKYGITR